ncbi:hypothetical protein BKA61DRAFT_622468 [Leptodontidium sp. MPI-SDFR-AT-0119]|nr:hypothetical protein BKA61DRAFT_622468 [Leptodontidium sp. MPI-SDFR-AT-0119]
MASWVSNTEAYAFELPTTPPTPFPSPTLPYASLYTALTHNLPDDSDPELQSLTCSHYGACSLSKWPKAIGKYATFPFNAEGQPHTTLIDSQIQNDVQQSERGQQRCSLATQFSRERPAPNDAHAWWRDTNIVRSTAQAASSASTLLDLGPIKRITEDFRTACNPLDTNIGTDCSIPPSATRGLSQNRQVADVDFSRPGVGSEVEAMRLNVVPSCYALAAKI